MSAVDRRGRGGEMQPPPPMRRRFSEPFTWIILGAVLVFVSGTASGVLSLVLLALVYSQGAPSFVAFLAATFTLAFVSPVGSFILLVGLARAVRPTRLPTPPTPTPTDPGIISPFPQQRIAPYRIAFAGAVINLIGGLGVVSVSLVRLAFRPTGPSPDFMAYVLSWNAAIFVAAAIAAVGSLLAFVGVGLAFRDGWR